MVSAAKQHGGGCRCGGYLCRQTPRGLPASESTKICLSLKQSLKHGISISKINEIGGRKDQCPGTNLAEL